MDLDLRNSAQSCELALNVADLADRLINHGIYLRLTNPKAIRTFMESHVFCVWDFQSLLKALQRNLTCIDVPWVPTADPSTRRLINEIVLDEESDEMPDGRYLSHFELYLEAMEQCGAGTRAIRGLVSALQRGSSVQQALDAANVPADVREFVDDTLEIADCGEIHRIAASFTYGRENVLPSMFTGIISGLARASDSWSLFDLYLRKHIEHDGERHGPLSKIMVERLCSDNPRLWREAEETARRSLVRRLNLWDSILARL